MYKFHPTTATDAYKLTHWAQRPKNLVELESYGEPRVGGQHSHVMFCGLQPTIKTAFMSKVDEAEIIHGRKRAQRVFGNVDYYPTKIWEKVAALGHYPLEIRAVKEGTVVPTGNVCYDIKATEDWFAPMVSHFEDWLMWGWYPTAVATRMYNIHKGIRDPFFESTINPNFDYIVNDFGLRGAAGYDAACLGGMAALILSNGSDNVPAMDFIEDYYGNDNIGGSVWATEHSVATVFGPGQGEYDYLETQLNEAGEDAIISIVIDSYDADNFIKNVVRHFKDRIIARKGRTVFRPDSGVPLTNMIKYSEMLGDIFGYHLNEKMFKVINHNVGLIQGDGMNENSIVSIYKDYIKTGWSAENFIVGSGGGLLVEGLSRDTDRWAVKCCHAGLLETAQEDMSSQGGPSLGEKWVRPINVCKAPKTDMTKSSKSGHLKLHKSANSFMTIESSKEQFGVFNGYTDELEVVFRNGEILRDMTFDQVRQIAKSYL